MINFEKKHFWVLSILAVIIGVGFVIAAINPSTDAYHILQKIAKTESDLTSVDANDDGIIDNSNHVPWTGISGIPAGFADGVDNVNGSGGGGGGVALSPDRFIAVTTSGPRETAVYCPEGTVRTGCTGICSNARAGGGRLAGDNGCIWTCDDQYSVTVHAMCFNISGISGGGGGSQYEFGGAYQTTFSQAGCKVPNPATSACSCPNGFTPIEVGGCSNDDNRGYVCYK